jgi:hypothetical protein
MTLEALCKRADTVNGVPSFVRSCVAYLSEDKPIRTVGLFRESGRALMINNVREAINEGQCMSITRHTHIEAKRLGS